MKKLCGLFGLVLVLLNSNLYGMQKPKPRCRSLGQNSPKQWQWYAVCFVTKPIEYTCVRYGEKYHGITNNSCPTSAKVVSPPAASKESFTKEEKQYLENVMEELYQCGLCKALFYRRDDLQDHKKLYMHI